MNNNGEIVMKLFLNILMGTTLIFGMMPIPFASAQGSFDKHKEEIELDFIKHKHLWNTYN